MPRLLRFFALLFVSCYTLNVLAAGYTCPTSKKYTSCAANYYVSNCGASSNWTGQTIATSALTTGNSCIACPSGYTCQSSAGLVCPKAATKSCGAGTYWNGSACANCGGNAYYCPGFSNVSNPASGYGRNSVSSGYYSTGGDANTRTGQSQCGGNAYYCSGGVRNSVSSGYYSTGGDANTRTGQSQCGTGTYCVSGVSNNCPTAYPNSVAGSTAITACYSGTKSRAWTGTQNDCALPTGCATKTCNACSNPSCDYVAYSNSAGNGDGTIKSGCSTNNAACTKTVASVTANAGYYTNGTACTLCPDWYQSGAGATSESGCVGSVNAGYYIATSKGGAVECPAGTAKGAHTVNYGSTSSCDACTGNTYSSAGASACTDCLTGYTITGADDHTSAQNCKLSCAGGTYLSTPNGTTCDNVGIGYWAAASRVSQGDVGVRNQCAAGLTTIGYGAGADEADDCGRVLNVGNNKVYLRSAKKTPKSLAVGINGVTYYGNMSTDISAPLKITSDGITYSVYDDSMN